jgi:hypothetical protein
VVDLILIPGDDCLEEIDLLAYTFLCHEMGHNALFRHGSAFAATFTAVLERVANVLQRQSLADRGAAKVHSQRSVNEMRDLWKPTSNHYN